MQELSPIFICQEKSSISAQHSSFLLIHQLFHFFLYHSSSFFLFQKSILILSSLSLECNLLFFSHINASCLSLIFRSILFPLCCSVSFWNVLSYKSQCQVKAVCTDKCWRMNGGLVSSSLFTVFTIEKQWRGFCFFYSLEVMTSNITALYMLIHLTV